MSYDAPAFNGGPDDREPLRGEGVRREPEAEAYPVGQPCGLCGRSMHSVYTLAGVGAFCSPKCRAKAQTAQAQQGAA